MKTLTKDSFAHILSAIVNVIFVLQIFLVAILVSSTFFKPDIFFIVSLEQLIANVLILIILWYIRKIFKAFKSNTFYSIDIVKALKYLSILLVVYVAVDYVFYVIKNYGVDYTSTGVMVLDFFVYYIKPIEYSLLFLSAISYLLSFVVKEGCELKEENSLIV